MSNAYDPPILMSDTYYGNVGAHSQTETNIDAIICRAREKFEIDEICKINLCVEDYQAKYIS